MKERQINTMMSARASSLLRKASGGFEPSLADKTKTRAAIARRVAVGVAAGAAISAGAKSAAAAPSIAPAALAPAAVVVPSAAAPVAVGFAGAGLATKFIAAVAIVGTVSAGAVTVHNVTRANPKSAATTQVASQNTARVLPQSVAANPIPTPVQVAPIAVDDLPPAQPTIALAPTPIANPRQITANHDAPATSEKPIAPSVTKAPAPQLGAENDLIERAQHALQAGDTSQALTLLNEHAERFPNGQRAEDRDAERVLTLCAAGRQEDAATAGAAFLGTYPNSIQASRVRSSCANDSAQ
jgi:hypothetical protein